MKKFYLMIMAAMATFTAGAANMQFTVNGQSVSNGDRINITNMWEAGNMQGVYNPHLMMKAGVSGELTATCSFTKSDIVPGPEQLWDYGASSMIEFCSIDGQCLPVNFNETKTKTGNVSAGSDINMMIELKLELGDYQTYEDLKVDAEFSLTCKLGGETSTLTFFVNKGDAGVDGILMDTDTTVKYYDLQGRNIDNPTNGIFIKKQGGKVSKVIL